MIPSIAMTTRRRHDRPLHRHIRDTETDREMDRQPDTERETYTDRRGAAERREGCGQEIEERKLQNTSEAGRRATRSNVSLGFLSYTEREKEGGLGE